MEYSKLSHFLILKSFGETELLTSDFEITSDTVLSSANFHNYEDAPDTDKSLIIAKNNQGPIFVPCGIPAGVVLKFEKQSELIFTRWDLSRWKSISQLTVVGLIPKLKRFAISNL